MASVAVGDTVSVPGDMHGVLKFIGPVAGKKGMFAGVQLANEYAGRGKNSGEVEGKQYFRTTIPGSGIFLPLDKAVKRPGSSGRGLGLSGARASPAPAPGTPRLTSFNQGGRTPGATGMVKPSFSQSVGPAAMRAGGAASPALKPPMRRESLPRPASPLRKTQTPTPKGLATPKTRPSGIGLARSTNGGAVGGPYARPPIPGQRNNFSQSLRQGSAIASPSLGPESSFDEIPEHEESTPTPTPTQNFSRKAATNDVDVDKYENKIRDLNNELEGARRQLSEQSSNFAEMEHSFNELQKILPSLEEGGHLQNNNRGIGEDNDLPRDVQTLREALRDKNDKIKALTAEFDANRADFRSTIDTLEMASTETERVYEKRVDELLEEVRNLQDRSEDVDTVAQQLKQLEELVQELEEGLEDARRGEAEARGEVEFLRGEVERSRSELRRERERLKTEDQLNGGGAYISSDEVHDLEIQLSSKDDEIRGLKVIINNLNTAAAASSPKRSSTTNGIMPSMPNNTSSHQRNDSTASLSDDALQKQIRDLESLLQQKSAHEEELAQEVKQLRNSVTMSKFPMPGAAAFGLHTAMRSPTSDNRKRHSGGPSDDMDRKHLSTGTVGSQKTVVMGGGGARGSAGHDSADGNWHDAVASPTKPSFGMQHESERAMDRSDDGVTDVSNAESAVLWCEICEESGHDILTCSNMFGAGQNDNNKSTPVNGGSTMTSPRKNGLHPSKPAGTDAEDPDRPRPLVSRKSTNNSMTSPTSHPPDEELPPPPTPIEHRTSSPSPFDSGTPTPAPAPPSTTAAPAATVAGEKPKLLEGTGRQEGMLGGRTSGVIDPEKWCALCERDGHDSVDCPLEDEF